MYVVLWYPCAFCLGLVSLYVWLFIVASLLFQSLPVLEIVILVPHTQKSTQYMRGSRSVEKTQLMTARKNTDHEKNTNFLYVYSMCMMYGVYSMCMMYGVYSMCMMYGVYSMCMMYGVYSMCMMYGVYSMCMMYGVYSMCMMYGVYSMCMMYGGRENTSRLYRFALLTRRNRFLW